MEELNLKIACKEAVYLCAPEIGGQDKRTHTIYVLRGA